jgi:hypothetical protein
MDYYRQDMGYFLENAINVLMLNLLTYLLVLIGLMYEGFLV